MTEPSHPSDVVPLVRLVREKVDASGYKIRPFAKARGISYSTLHYYYEQVHGPLRQMPRTDTIDKLAHALRVSPEQVRRAALDSLAGSHPASQEPTTDVDVREAIERDPRLLPEARAHLLNQYELLLRLQEAAPPELLDRQDRRRRAAVSSADEQAQVTADLTVVADADPAAQPVRRRSPTGK